MFEREVVRDGVLQAPNKFGLRLSRVRLGRGKKPGSVITDLHMLLFAMETRLERMTSKDSVRRQPDES